MYHFVVCMIRLSAFGKRVQDMDVHSFRPIHLEKRTKEKQVCAITTLD